MRLRVMMSSLQERLWQGQDVIVLGFKVDAIDGPWAGRCRITPPASAAPGFGAPIQVLQIFDVYGIPIQDGLTAPAQGGVSLGRVAIRIMGPTPGSNGAFCDVSLRAEDAADPSIAGGSGNYTRVWFAVPVAPVQHAVMLYQGGTVIFTGQITGADDLRLTLDGTMIFPGQILGRTGQFG